MQPFWEIVASNALLVVVLAAGVALLGRVWKNPLYLHLLWIFVLLKLVTPPLLTVPLPLPAGRVLPASEEHATDWHMTRQSQSSQVEVSGQETAAVTVATPEGDSPISAGTTIGTVSHLSGVSWLTIFAWIWGVGIVLFAFGHACRIVQFRRLLSRGAAPSSAVLDMAERIAGRLGLRRVPPIRMLPVRVSPLVWSLGGRPRVFLSAALFERLDAAAQEAILAHELAHVRRGDHWVRLLEMVVVTLFWWHPVAWWAACQLQELEDRCCDCEVVAMSPHGVKSYATALLDTLDFLSERSVAAPLGATAAKSSNSLARRIIMLKNRTPDMRLTVGRLAIVVAAAIVPMAVAFGQKPPEVAKPAKSSEKPVVQRRAVNKLVKDFPEKTDLSTPESAAAAFHRVIMKSDPKLWLDLSAWKYTARDVEEIKRKMEANRDKVAKQENAYRNAEIIEVLIYRGDLADVISKLEFPNGIGHNPYSARAFVRIDGEWKNFGENRLASLDEARKDFERIKDNLWANYLKVLDGIKQGKPVPLHGDRPKRTAPIAPGEPLGISVEKADLMGRIEWAMMHGGRDVTARKSIEWGDVQKDKDGNRTIRYKYYATIWDKDVYIINQVFTFDAKGNILDVKNVEGFPKKKVEKPVDVGTQKGMKELVEDFFSKNFVDITSRETIEWGEVVKDKNGNSSIRYQYRAKIWDKDVKIMNQIFTFDPKGQFVSVKDVEGFPKN